VYQSKVQDEYLKQTLGFGIWMHHAGLTSEDRNIIEEVFVGGKI
jgi:replicative superfamily II helicase